MAAHNETRYRGRSRWLRLHADDRGVALVSVGLLGAFLVMISVIVAVRTMQTSSSVAKDRYYEQAIHVAESGADQALYALDTGADLAEVTLTATPTKAEVVDAALAVAAADSDEVLSTPEGDVVVIKDDTTNKAFAVGFSPAIDSARKTARVIVVDYSLNPGVPIIYPEGAVVADGDVTFVGNGDTATNPASAHSADVHSNGNFTGNENTHVDGDANAAGTASGGSTYGDHTSGADAVPFPTQDEIDAWQASLLTTAMTGPTLATLPPSSSGSFYVAGSVSLNCVCTITLNGLPGDVVYVDGSINIGKKSHLVNNGVILVAAENFEMTGQSKYSVTGDLLESGLVVFGTDWQAAKITGQGSAAAQGFVYVPNGGAKTSGNGAVVGSIIAGGGVSVTGSGGIIYPDGLNGGTSVTPPVGGSPVVDDINELGIGEL
ncbi:MAG: hypothetical protein V3R84_01950 [Acidimicrobiia bacterium]